MPNNPHRSNLTARLADSQELAARVAYIGLERLKTVQQTYDAADYCVYGLGSRDMLHAIQRRRDVILRGQ